MHIHNKSLYKIIYLHLIGYIIGIPCSTCLGYDSVFLSLCLRFFSNNSGGIPEESSRELERILDDSGIVALDLLVSL